MTNTLRPYDVTVCLVTRGDQPEMVERIIDSLSPIDYHDVIVWDNSQREDMKTAGRYAAAQEAKTDVVLFQDDDVILPLRTQLALRDAYEPGMLVANYAHGENHGGYADLPLVGGGAIADKELFPQAFERYLAHWPHDDAMLYEADFVVGILTPFKHIYEPFEIDLAIAQAPERLCNQPWQRDLKLKITNQARQVRDMVAA